MVNNAFCADMHTATLTAMPSTAPLAGSPTSPVTEASTSLDNVTGIAHSRELYQQRIGQE